MHRLQNVLRSEEHRQKHRCQWFFKNIAKSMSLSKKHNVLHDVLGFRNCIQSFDKSMDIHPKM